MARTILSSFPATYGTRTLIGNWQEELCMSRVPLSADSTSLQSPALVHSDRLVANYYADVPLEPPCTHLRYGAVVQLCAVEFDQPHSIDHGRQQPISKPTSSPMVLSLYLRAAQIRFEQLNRLSHRCAVSVAAAPKSCRRNSFRLRRSRHQEPGAPTDRKQSEHPDQLLRYGDLFELELVERDERTDDALLLYSSPNNIGVSSDKPQVGVCRCRPVEQPDALCPPADSSGCVATELYDIPSLHCSWKVLHIDPRWRYEMEGEPVESNVRVVICHAATNNYLAVEDLWTENYFGLEAGVTLGRFQNVHRCETYQTIWSLKTSETQ